MLRPGFRERSYFNWGLKEIQRRIDDYCEAGYDEYEVINLFIDEMEKCACENRANSVAFSCAADAGKWMLENYIAYYM